jgi:hypothetical protein
MIDSQNVEEFFEFPRSCGNHQFAVHIIERLVERLIAQPNNVSIFAVHVHSQPYNINNDAEIYKDLTPGRPEGNCC